MRILATINNKVDRKDRFPLTFAPFDRSWGQGHGPTHFSVNVQPLAAVGQIAKVKVKPL